MIRGLLVFVLLLGSIQGNPIGEAVPIGSLEPPPPEVPFFTEKVSSILFQPPPEGSMRVIVYLYQLLGRIDDYLREEILQDR